ncbi:chitin deacetylase 7 [Hydra vulgaris]|uniref:chitin deacetylase 7 n=1 Tax=Hydra vulgaris TaxID=6087 RepID=UPI0032EA3AAF
MAETFTAPTQAKLILKNFVLQESLQPASSCNVANCLFPLCRCAGTDIPGGLSKVNTPQMILLTMDDGVTSENYQLYSELLSGMTNFNGCPIKATFFVSGDNTDYAYVKKLQQSGHEIADHSMTHKFPIDWWSTSALEDLQMEILTQKNTIQQEIGTTTLGWRTPFLASQENTFKVLAENQFLYDSSLVTFPGTRWWPYTLDYLPSLPCYMTNCPKDAYPGLWEIPLVTLQCDESATTFASMLDECTNLDTEESTYNMLMINFKLHYEDSKQPFPMFGHSTWFDNAPYRKDAVIRFMNDVRKFNDVYFVTAQQAIQWIKSPVGIDEMPFSCDRLKKNQIENVLVNSVQLQISPNESVMTKTFTAPSKAELILTNLVLPESLQPASSCNVANCILPSCRCAGTDIPGGLSKVNTPQMILLTMDDGVTSENYQLYSELLSGMTNFNGCPIKATFFVSGDNTDYAYVKKLQQSGHEIADHSMTHKFPIDWWSKSVSFGNTLISFQLYIFLRENIICRSDELTI